MHYQTAALDHVYPESDQRTAALERLRRAVDWLRMPNIWPSLSDWSEVPGRTAEEVRELCERAGV